MIEKRKIDILYAALIFEGEVLTCVDDREDYGERRFISMGMADGECFVVVHTRRQEMTRLTAWKGGRNGRAEYEAGIARRHQTDEGEG
ncbi:BrnT family toxin [Rhizobium binxianense]